MATNRPTYALAGTINWTTPQANQGQIVEVSYGWHAGRLYRHTLDRSDRTAMLERAEEDASDALSESWHPVNGRPSIPAEAWETIGVSA